MPFVFKRLAEHGTTNPIVARLSLQSLTILRECKVSQEVSDRVGDLYIRSLQPKLLRCWEIRERFREEFNAAVAAYSTPTGQVATVPQISRLDLECQDFLYQAKNYIRDTLLVVNALYGTDFEEASQFSKARKSGSKKARPPLIAWAATTFGADAQMAKLFRDAAQVVNFLIEARNAVEHPGGHSGNLQIDNFDLAPEGQLNEPTWHRTQNGKVVTPVSSIRSDLDVSIRTLLVLGESAFVSWAAEHLKMPGWMQIATIPEEQRDPQCPVKYRVVPGDDVQQQLNVLLNKQ